MKCTWERVQSYHFLVFDTQPQAKFIKVKSNFSYQAQKKKNLTLWVYRTQLSRYSQDTS